MSASLYTSAREGQLTLERLDKHIWQRLLQACEEPSSPWRTPVLATTPNGVQPFARTIILRSIGEDCASLFFFTDKRSLKMSQIVAHSAATAVFYDAVAGEQLRAFGTISVEGAVLTKKMWENTAPASRYAFRVKGAPGTAVGGPTGGQPDKRLPTQLHKQDTEPYFVNFAVLQLFVRQLDWLYLTDDGNRAARIQKHENQRWTREWVLP